MGGHGRSVEASHLLVGERIAEDDGRRLRLRLCEGVGVGRSEKE